VASVCRLNDFLSGLWLVSGWVFFKRILPEGYRLTSKVMPNYKNIAQLSKLGVIDNPCGK
jgi:hypothetical protein